MKLHRLGAAFLGLLLALHGAAAQAQWAWRDRNGQLYASDRPPPSDVPERDIVKRPPGLRRSAPPPVPTAVDAAASAAAVLARPRIDPELEARLKRAEQEKQAAAERDKARLAAQRADNCQRAQESMRTYESGIRVTRLNERGEREFLDDAARAEQVARIQQVIDSDCR